MDLPQGLQVVSSVVALAGSGFTLFWRFPDRRRTRDREQHQTLTALFAQGGDSQHDWVVESAFRAAFGASVPAHIVRFFAPNKFPLTAVEEYCAVREYLSPDDPCSTFEFRRRRHRVTWMRRFIIGVWVGAYGALGLLALGVLQLGRANLVGRLALFGILVVLAVFCVRQGGLLFRAGKFIRRLPSYARPRTPRIATERGVEAAGVRRDVRALPRAAS